MFQIVGGVILGLTLLSQVIINSHGGGVADETSAGRTVGFIVLYIMGSVVMVISILGACGAHKENRVCLIVVSTGGNLGRRMDVHRTGVDLCVLVSWTVPGVYGCGELDHTPAGDKWCHRPSSGDHAHSPFYFYCRLHHHHHHHHPQLYD